MVETITNVNICFRDVKKALAWAKNPYERLRV